MTSSQCKQFCITHFKEMITEQIGRTVMKKVARYCQACTVWYWKNLWKSIYCPCCHKKLRDQLSNLVRKVKKHTTPLTPVQLERQRLYSRQWRQTHKEQKNTYQRDWYKRRLLSSVGM